MGARDCCQDTNVRRTSDYIVFGGLTLVNGVDSAEKTTLGMEKWLRG